MRKHITCVLTLGLMLAGSIAHAQTPRQASPKPGPAQQRLHIAQRMREGARSGQLTRLEVQRLRQRLAEIRKHGQAMRANRTLAPEERRKLLREWRQASRALFVMRHNRFRRGR